MALLTHLEYRTVA